MPQLITIGETMAAFTPDSVGALRYVQNFGIRTAGAESNVAVGLAKLGLEAAWVSPPGHRRVWLLHPQPAPCRGRGLFPRHLRPRPPHRHHVQGDRRGRDQSVLLP